jgi:hypothetical protein
VLEVAEGLNEGRLCGYAPLHDFDGVFFDALNRRVLMAPGAVEGSGGIQIDHPTLMFGMATQAGDFAIASQVGEFATGDQPAIGSNVIAAMRIRVDVTMTGDTTVGSGTMPRLMT